MEKPQAILNIDKQDFEYYAIQKKTFNTPAN